MTRSAAFLLVWVCALAPGEAPGQDDLAIPAETIEVGDDQSSDARIARRLRAIFAELEDLKGLELTVSSGVVRLSGTVVSSYGAETAVTLAEKIEGVTAVENRVEVSRSLALRLSAALERLGERGWTLVGQAPLFVVAILLFLAVLWLGHFLTSFDLATRWITRNPFLANLARQTLRIGFAAAGLLLALEVLDATAMIGAVLGAAGVVGLALGFAFRDIVENYVASVLLSLRQPFLPNDHVRIEGFEGRVVRLSSRATVLLSMEGNHIRLPNSLVFKGAIENFTRKPERRFSFSVGVGVDEDLVGAQDLGCAILAETNGVLASPPPAAVVDELGDSSVALGFFGWVDQRSADFRKVRIEAIRRVKQAFDREDIEMPEPIHRVRVSSAEAPAPPREEPPPDERPRDVSPDRHLEREVEEERSRIDDDDLLDVHTPFE